MWHEIFVGCGCFCAGVEMFSEESILCFQAAYVRAVAQHRTPLIVCPVLGVRGACLSSLRAAAENPFDWSMAQRLSFRREGKGKGRLA